jgi:hypothetical protein
LNEDIQIIIREKIRASLNSQGEIVDCDIRGSLSLRVNNPEVLRPIIEFINSQKFANLKPNPNFD